MESIEIHPPKLARWIMTKLSIYETEMALTAMLDEEFEIISKSGLLKARAWYWWQTVQIILKYASLMTYWSFAMFNNYIKIALRHIHRHKGYSFINIFGLAIGMACCLLIVLYVQDELSYDNFHINGRRIFRVVASCTEDGQPTNANGIFGTGPLLKKDFPEVEDYVRIRRMGQGVKRYIGYKGQKFYEERFFFADPSVFTVFSFPLIEGDAESVLNEPNSIVITESMAAKYFGADNPIGKTLETDPYNTGEFIYFNVTGIAKDVPYNSHFHFDFLASYADQTEKLTSLSGLMPHYTYILLNKEASAKTLEPKLLDFLHRNWREDPWYTNHLQPLLDIRLHSHLRAEIEPNGNIAYIYTFSAIAVFVLLIACINFINLSTARSTKRAKEVGLRKVIGAHKRQLLRQFLGESVLVSLISGVTAILLVIMLLPFFNNLVDKSVSVNYLMRLIPFAVLLSIIVIVGIISGGYIALVLSTYSPVRTIKGMTGESGKKSKFREGLVIFQFVISIIMIVCTLTAQKQMHYIQTQSTGYARNEILAIPLNTDARNSYEALRGELLKSPAIRNTTTSSYVPTQGSYHMDVTFEDVEEPFNQVIYFIDREFADTYGMDILEGSDIEKKVFDAERTEFLISELTVTDAGYKSWLDAIGKEASFGNVKGAVKGIVGNLNLYSFHSDVYSMTFFVTPIRHHNYMSIRLDAGQYGTALAHIRKVWSRVIPNYPLDYFFLDESFEQMHRAEQRLGAIFQYFGAIAVIVACMGLLGLAVFTAERRTKEIGIRKTLGAPMLNIYVMLSKTFVKWVILANIIAWPVAHYVMSQWLNNFAFRTNIDVGTFILSGFIAFAIALLTVSWQSVKSARARPIDSLKYE